jgi:hypothetical protein
LLKRLRIIIVSVPHSIIAECLRMHHHDGGSLHDDDNDDDAMQRDSSVTPAGWIALAVLTCFDAKSVDDDGKEVGLFGFSVDRQSTR